MKLLESKEALNDGYILQQMLLMLLFLQIKNAFYEIIRVLNWLEGAKKSLNGIYVCFYSKFSFTLYADI